MPFPKKIEAGGIQRGLILEFHLRPRSTARFMEDMSYILNSSEGGYIRDDIGDCLRGY